VEQEPERPAVVEHPVTEEPEDVERWNWGAWLFPTFWASYYRIWWAVAAVAVPLPLIWPLGVVGWNFIWWVQIPVAFVLGKKGNRWAWDKWHGRKWKTLEEFHHAQRRWVMGGLLGTVAAIAIGAGALDPLFDTGSSGPPTEFSAHGVTFDYPGNWDRGSKNDLTSAEGFEDAIWVEPFFLTKYDLIAVSADGIPIVVDERNAEELVQVFSGEVRELGMDPLEGVHRISIAGRPAIEGTAHYEVDGRPIAQVARVVIAGTALLRWDCQYTREHEEDVKRACDMETHTVRLAPPFDERLGWSELESERGDIAAMVPPQWKESSETFGSGLTAESEVGFLFVTSEPGFEKLDAYEQAVVAGFRGDPTWIEPPRVVSSRKADLPAGTAHVLHLRGEIDEGVVHWMAYVLANNGRGYTLAVAMSEERLPFLGPTAEAIARTLELER
jgi:hypothetical protein